MRKIIGATMLALLLSAGAQAGDGIMQNDVTAAGIMQFDKTQPPPPPPAPSAAGIIQYDVTAAAARATVGALLNLAALF